MSSLNFHMKCQFYIENCEEPSVTERECFCCELGVAVAPSQEVVFVRVLIKQLDLQILPGVVVNQGLETQTGAALRYMEINSAKRF